MLACLLAASKQTKHRPVRRGAEREKKRFLGRRGGPPACNAAAFSFVLPRPSRACLAPVSRFLAAPQALFFSSPAVRRRAQQNLFRYPRQLEKALGTGSKQAPRTNTKNSKHKIPRRHFFPSPFFPHPLCPCPLPPETYIRCQIKPLFCTVKFGGQLLTPPSRLRLQRGV